MRGRGWVPDDGNPREPGNGPLEQLQALGHSLAHDNGEPRDVAARPSEAGHVAGADGIRVAREYYGNRRGRSLGRSSVDGSRCNDDINLEPDQFLHQAWEPIEPPLGPAVLDRDVLSLDPTQIAQTLAERFERMRPHGRGIPQKSDTVDLPRLLRASRERRGEDGANHARDEGPAVHH